MLDDTEIAIIRARCEGTSVIGILDEQDAHNNHPDREKLIELARETYASDDVEIDDDATLSRGDSGCWVQAWVFLYNDEFIAKEAAE
jgi:hypothetical protein